VGGLFGTYKRSRVENKAREFGEFFEKISQVESGLKRTVKRVAMSGKFLSELVKNAPNAALVKAGCRGDFV
jgi:hypothetical protein